MISLLILFIIILLLFIVQFELKSTVSFNMITNTGKITVKLLNFTIIKYNVSLKNGYIELRSRRKQIFLPLKFDHQSIKEVSKLDDFIFSKVYFKRVNILLNVGIKNDAFKTAMLSGALNVLGTNMLVALKNAKNEVLESIKIYNNFDKTEFKGVVKSKISISIIDLIWCVAENFAFKQIYKNSIKNNE